MFSVSADLCSGFPRNSSLVLPLLSVAGFSVIAVSCDEDVEEAGVDDAEELVDKPGTTKGALFDLWQSVLLPSFGEMCVFDRWSSGKYTHDPRRASREKELWVFLQEAPLSRVNQIL